MVPKKLCVVSGSFPPEIIGSPILLHNLLAEYGGPVEAIAFRGYGAKIDPSFQPPCKTHYLNLPSAFLRRILTRYLDRSIPFLRAYIKQKLRHIKPHGVLGVCPRGEFFVAAYQASRALGVPFMAHMHDLWEENQEEGSNRERVARKWEREILGGSRLVFCITETQRVYYRAKHKIEPRILPHTVPSKRVKDAETTLVSGPARKNRSIVYTGNISKMMNLDSLRQVIKAVDWLPEEFKVKMFVSWDREELRRWGVFHRRVQYNWLPMNEVQREMQAASVLLLPLSFKNASMDEVRTVFATKTLDYLVSGTPIVVFSPPDSFQSLSAKERGWGRVVEEDDPRKLADAIVDTARDPRAAHALVTGALKEAKRREARKHAKRLFESVQAL